MFVSWIILIPLCLAAGYGLRQVWKDVFGG